MALNFPGSPTNGQQYQGFVYNSTVQAWQSNPASVAPFYTADTPPTNPTKGDSWFNTNDGTMYIYTYDGNTYQWVEHRSQIAKSQVGLVPIIPTSVAANTGSASISSTGVITATGVNLLDINGCFSATYENYTMTVEGSSTGGAQNIVGRFRNSGTPAGGDTTADSYVAQLYMSDTTAPTKAYSAQNFVAIGSIGAGHGFARVDIVSPFLTKSTYVVGQYSYNEGAASGEWGQVGGRKQSTGSWAGISISLGAFTGKVRIYGHN